MSPHILVLLAIALIILMLVLFFKIFGNNRIVRSILFVTIIITIISLLIYIFILLSPKGPDSIFNKDTADAQVSVNKAEIKNAFSEDENVAIEICGDTIFVGDIECENESEFEIVFMNNIFGRNIKYYVLDNYATDKTCREVLTFLKERCDYTEDPVRKKE